MLRNILTICLALSLTQQICKEGCLKCDANDNCLICDLSKKFFLDAGTCKLSDKTNCLLVGNDGNCLACNLDFFLDSNTKNCVAVDTTKKITNCASYSATQICNACVTAYFLKDAKCSAVTKSISNCSLYIDDGKCGACSGNYILALDTLSCIEEPANQKCKF